MTEMTTIAHGSETADASHGRTAFSYCCECGTYDAHITICTCCGFDFGSEQAASDTE